MGEKISKKLLERLKNDFGDAGREYLDVKMKQKGIIELDNLPDYVQQRFLVDFIHGLYGDVLSARRLKEIILEILIDLYGFTEAEEVIIWADHFRGSPPISFFNFFFGEILGSKLIEIEEKRLKVSNLHDEEDAVQFSFVINFIKRLFKNLPSLIENLSSNFMRYLIDGKKGKVIKLETFISQNSINTEHIFFEINNYLTENEKNLDKNNDIFMAVERFRKHKGLLNLKDVNFSEGKDRSVKRNIEKDILEELGKYIDGSELSSLLEDAKKIAEIQHLSSASKDKKQKFVNYLITNSSVHSSSDQRERLVRNWLMRILGI